jgi:hypothetical protein
MIQRALAFAGLLYLVAASIVNADGPVTLAQYRGAVEQALSLIDQSAQAAPGDPQNLLKQAADVLERVREVQLESGAQLLVDNSTLVKELRSAVPNATAARGRLEALRSTLAQPIAAVNDADLSKLRELLSRPPFVRATSTNWLTELIAEFLDWLRGVIGNGARGVFDRRDLIVLLGIAVAVVAVAFAFRNLRRNIVPEENRPARGNAIDAATSTEALDRAQRFASAGDYRAAVRQLYLATLLLLDERGVLRYDRSLTNREYLREVADAPALARALEPIVETFDRTWYGFETIGPSEFENYRRQVEAIGNVSRVAGS